MKTCVLCPNTIKPQYRLCYSCYKEYGGVINEPWFKEIEAMQKRQDRIDTRESYALETGAVNMYGKVEPAIVSSKKNVGRPPTNWLLINEVLQRYDESLDNEKAGKGRRLSLRKLEKAMNGRVKFLTIRRILMTYRTDSFPNK